MINKCASCTKRYVCEGEYEFDCLNKNYMYFIKGTENHSNMLKLSEHNEIIRKEIAERDRARVYCGVACDNCGTELKYVDYNSVLMSYPAQKSVVCPKCGRRDYIVIKR